MDHLKIQTLFSTFNQAGAIRSKKEESKYYAYIVNAWHNYLLSSDEEKKQVKKLLKTRGITELNKYLSDKKFLSYI